ncbi:MAG: hypothetical protein DSY60_02370 [Persephonella sp.]|nr:MAG: hypothetical protein DSY60_02370 [Persephonella sp.]
MKGKFANLITSAIFLGFSTTFGSGLDIIDTIVSKEDKLQKKVPKEDIETALNSAHEMNKIIIEAIYRTGVANDERITPADIREINKYILKNYKDEWVILHGDDEENEETGFHLIQKDGAKIKIFGKNAINKVFDGIYHLGFPIVGKRLTNEDGNKNANIKNVALWLNKLLEEDIKNGDLYNPDVEEIKGETGTGLDKVIDIIFNDKGLQLKCSTGDLREAAKSANEMNKILIEAINAIDALEDKKITKDEIFKINRYIVENYGDVWQKLHGNDEEGKETGFHKVVKNGAKTKLFEKNAINKVFDGIYHLGFPIDKKRLTNEDGNRNVPVKKIAEWLTKLLNE